MYDLIGELTDATKGDFPIIIKLFLNMQLDDALYLHLGQ